MFCKAIGESFQLTGHSETLEGPFKAGSVSSVEVKYFTVLGVDLKISVEHQLELITLMLQTTHQFHTSQIFRKMSVECKF